MRRASVLVLMFMTASNLSASESRFYIEAGLGLSSVNGVADTNPTFVSTDPPEALSLFRMPFDDDDISWGGLIGFRLNQYVGIQLGYGNLGKFRADRFLNTSWVELEVQELSMSARLEYPLTKSISANWSFGISRSSFDVDGYVEWLYVPVLPLSGPVTGDRIPFSSPSDENGYLWGFGFSWQLIPKVSLDLGYLQHGVQVLDVETINLGLIVEL